jgi:copper homeostasis protein (lipoprotein)
MRALICLTTLALGACSSPSGDTLADGAHNSRNSLDWAGSYTGITPCADCEGIRTTVTLQQDGTYTRELIYLGKSGRPVSDAGPFAWNDAGSGITLAPGSESSQQYQVGENRLYHLDRAGNRIAGELADRYMLEKTGRDPRIEDRRWLLVEVMGQPFEPSEALGEAFILLDSSQGRVSGHASCNNFFGSYVLLAGGRIRFVGNLGATMMACPDMTIETAVLEALATIDNYSVGGDALSLNRARMAPLLRFRLATDAG